MPSDRKQAEELHRALMSNSVKRKIDNMHLRNADIIARATGGLGPDYDYGKAKELGLKRDNRGHLGDIGKLPWHQTFSVESAYSNDKYMGGRWIGNNFQPSLDMLKSGATHGLSRYMRYIEPGSKLLPPPPVSIELFERQVGRVTN